MTWNESGAMESLSMQLTWKRKAEQHRLYLAQYPFSQAVMKSAFMAGC